MARWCDVEKVDVFFNGPQLAPNTAHMLMSRPALPPPVVKLAFARGFLIVFLISASIASQSSEGSEVILMPK